MMKKLHLYILFLVLTNQGINAQCYPDQHSTNWYDGWVSCEISPNPISSYGETHWVMYDLGYEYVLNETKFWNTNTPKHLDNGINEYTIDYSLDGVIWSNLGTYNMERASGKSNYEGKEGPNFDATKARYVLITPNSNYGGTCFGFSELKISITDPFVVIEEEDGFNASVYPNPFVDDISLRIASLDKNTPVNFTLHDITGRLITRNTINISEDSQTYKLPIKGNALPFGIYIFKIKQNNKEKAFKLIKR